MGLGRALSVWFAACLLANASVTPPGYRRQNSLVDSKTGLGFRKPWDAPPLETQEDNLIFYRLSTLLQHWPNTRYPSGQSIVPGTIPVGTTLYHGNYDTQPPTVPQWLAFDPQHSLIFSFGSENRLLTYVTTRDLRILYFDGASAAKISSGSSDTQQLLLRRTVNNITLALEHEMIVGLCEWGKEFGIDGFVRMEPDFEMMHCDFSENVKLVSSVHIIPTEDTFKEPSRSPVEPSILSSVAKELLHLPNSAEQAVLSDPPPPPPFETRPPNWKGALPESRDVAFEFLRAGTLHSRAPGEVRIRLDAARLVTLYDPALLSGIELRRGKQKVLHRGKGMSREDIATWRGWVAGTVREDRPAVSGVDWQALAATIVNRYSARLKHLRSLLHPDEVTRNVTAVVREVRSQLLLALLTDITADDVPDANAMTSTTSLQDCRKMNRDRAWVKPIADRCSSFVLSHLPEQKMTREERTLYAAVSGTQAEICRVLSLMWADAYDPPSCVPTRALAGEWRGRVEGLMEWLDWPVWSQCEPGCGSGTICFIPTWPVDIGVYPMGYTEKLDQIDWTPRCLRNDKLKFAFNF